MDWATLSYFSVGSCFLLLYTHPPTFLLRLLLFSILMISSCPRIHGGHNSVTSASALVINSSLSTPNPTLRSPFPLHVIRPVNHCLAVLNTPLPPSARPLSLLSFSFLSVDRCLFSLFCFPFSTCCFSLSPLFSLSLYLSHSPLSWPLFIPISGDWTHSLFTPSPLVSSCTRLHH